MRSIPERVALRLPPDSATVFDMPLEMFMILGDVAHLSRCVDIVTWKVSTICEAGIPLANYIKLAQNIDPLRSWANYIRGLTIEELQSSDYEAVGVNSMRTNLDDSIKHIEAANTILDAVLEDAKTNVAQSRSIALEFNEAGRALETLVGTLPPIHRVKDLVSNSLFKKDVANRPIRTMYSVCVKTLTLMAELEEEIGEDGKPKTWGKWRDQESRLRYWGHDRIDGQAPVDSYIEIGNNEETEDDAQFLCDAFSMILYIQCQSLPFALLCFPQPHTDHCLDEYIRDRIAAHATSEPSSPQHLDEAQLEDCQSLYSRVYYILNTDFMFFPTSERWADKMITELARGSGVADKYNFSEDPVTGIDTAFDILQRLTKSITPNAFHMSHDPSVWPNGHLWHESVAQVNKRSEGSERVVPRRSILRDAIGYYEMLETEQESQASTGAGKLRARVTKFIRRLGFQSVGGHQTGRH